MHHVHHIYIYILNIILYYIILYYLILYYIILYYIIFYIILYYICIYICVYIYIYTYIYICIYIYRYIYIYIQIHIATFLSPLQKTPCWSPPGHDSRRSQWRCRWPPDPPENGRRQPAAGLAGFVVDGKSMETLGKSMDFLDVE